jgi:superfamily I DNA/RNA helicase
MLTDEQNEIIQSVKENNLTKVIARAGCGKTFTLTKVVEQLKPKKALYLAYNKAIKEEAEKKFPSSIEVKTVHALALKYTRMVIDDFKHYHIKENLQYKEKALIIDTLDKFFNSEHTKLNQYLTELHLDTKLINVATSYVMKMANREIPAPFGFVIKMFHILLADKDIKLNYDLVLLDEAGDTTGVILEIFKLIKADRKIMVGDPYQNIYTFTHTIDGFSYLKDDRAIKELTNTFRLTKEIADNVKEYCKTYIDENFHFEGTASYQEPKNKAYLARTNSSIIKRIIKLIDENTKFKTNRPLKEIFSLPLAISNIQNSKYDYIPNQYKYLVNDHKNYLKNKKTGGSKSFLGNLQNKYSEDITVKSAINLLLYLGGTRYNIFSLYKTSQEYNCNTSNITVSTIHSSKGLEWDWVYIENDMATTITKILEEGGPIDNNEQSEFYLMYVAMSRAKYKLENYEIDIKEY